MSLFQMPRLVNLRLEKIQKDFLWGNLVNWATVCLDKSKGGLGVKHLPLLNMALFCKWNWRFATEREAF